MARLYNPKNGSEYTTASDDEAHVAVYLEAGWQRAPEPEVKVGYEPEPVTYAPVLTDGPKTRRTTKSAKDEASE